MQFMFEMKKFQARVHINVVFSSSLLKIFQNLLIWWFCKLIAAFMNKSFAVWLCPGPGKWEFEIFCWQAFKSWPKGQHFPYVQLFWAGTLYEPHHEKTCLCHMRTTRGADYPAHPHSLISTFIVRCLDSIIPILDESKISRLASLCSLAGRFESYLSETPKTGFLVMRPISSEGNSGGNRKAPVPLVLPRPRAMVTNDWCLTTIETKCLNLWSSGVMCVTEAFTRYSEIVTMGED